MKKDFRNNSIYHEEIDIDITEGVALHLTRDEYARFVSKLEPQLDKQVIDFIARNDKADKKMKTCRDFALEIRELFYDLEGDWGIVKDIKDIDVDKLEDVLFKYSEQMGF